MKEEIRTVPRTGSYPGMTEITLNGRSVQMPGVGKPTQDAIRKFMKETGNAA